LLDYLRFDVRYDRFRVVFDKIYHVLDDALGVPRFVRHAREPDRRVLVRTKVADFRDGDVKFIAGFGYDALDHRAFFFKRIRPFDT